MTSIIENGKTIEFKKWLSLNTAADPSRLLVGQTPNCDNVWVDEKPGSLVTSPGFLEVGEAPTDNPITLCFNFFRQSDGSQTFIVSDNETVWWTTDFANFTEIATGLAGGFQLRAVVIRDKLWLTNGSDPVMVWDGSTLVQLDGQGGRPLAPAGRYIAYHHERVWLYHIVGNRSDLRFTALTDDTGTEIAPDDQLAWPSANHLQISEGDSDFGTGLIVYRGNLYAFKQNSIYRIVGDDEFSYTRIKTRASVGTRFSESIREIDDVLQFISRGGVYKFNGDETIRISDIITRDIANLQQPFLNNRFWTLTDADGFDAGTVPANIDTDSDSLLLAPADDSHDDFSAGVVKSNINVDSSPGDIKLSDAPHGQQTQNVAVGSTVEVTPPGLTFESVPPNRIVDGSTAAPVTFILNSVGATQLVITIVLPSSYRLGRLLFLGFGMGATSWSSTRTMRVEGFRNGSYETIYTDTLRTNSSSGISTGTRSIDLTQTWDTTRIRLTFTDSAIPGSFSFGMSEFQFLPRGYMVSGKFVSKTLDYTTAPHSFGSLVADIALNSQSATFFTQSSADGSTWDSEVNVANGGSIGSSVARYLRWGVYLTSSGLQSPVIDKVFLGGTYISPVFDTGGDIHSWGIFEAGQTLRGQTILYFYRAGANSGAVTVASWTQIERGAFIGADPLTESFIQIRVFLSTTDADRQPEVEDTTVNWVKGGPNENQTTQNVASWVWNSRYWLSAARQGSEENDVILVRGKREYAEPWTRKQWNFLSFAEYQDNFYGGSSVDGKICRLDTGYRLGDSAMESLFETGDISGDGESGRFAMVELLEIGLVAELMGEYNLTVGVSTDRGTTWTDKTISLSGTGRKKLQLNVNHRGDYFRIRLKTSGIDQPFEVHELFAHYRVLNTTRASLVAA